MTEDPSLHPESSLHPYCCSWMIPNTADTGSCTPNQPLGIGALAWLVIDPSFLEEPSWPDNAERKCISIYACACMS